MKELGRKSEKLNRPDWCGAAVLASIAKDLGVYVSQEDLVVTMEMNPGDGAEHRDLAGAAEYINLNYLEGTSFSLRDLNTFVASGAGVIVNTMMGDDPENDGHYMRFLYSDYRSVIVEDMNTKETIIREYTTKEFEDMWWDIDQGMRVDNWAMIIYRTK